MFLYHLCSFPHGLHDPIRCFVADSVDPIAPALESALCPTLIRDGIVDFSECQTHLICLCRPQIVVVNAVKTSLFGFG